MSFSATTVCCSFVKQYYEGLLWNPKSLPACYGADSSLTCNDAEQWDQPAVTVTGSADIAQALEALSSALKQKQLRILSADAIPSFEDSLLIIVRGVILSPEFAQRYDHTFLLRQNGVEGEFYIRNDVWLYSEKESLAPEVPEVPEPMAESAVSAAVAEPLPSAGQSLTNSPARKAQSETSNRATPSAAALVPDQKHRASGSDLTALPAQEPAARAATPETQPDSAHAAHTPVVAPATNRTKESPATQSSATVSPATQSSVTASPASAVSSSSGPKNWATLVKSAPNPPAPAEKPQRVSPKPQPVVTKEEPKLSASGSGSQKGLKDTRPKREEPKCRVTMKIRTGAATDDAIKAALPQTLIPHLLSLRNLSATKFVVFMDFSEPNALAMLQEARVTVAGTPVLFELQKPREN